MSKETPKSPETSQDSFGKNAKVEEVVKIIEKDEGASTTQFLRDIAEENGIR